jgi:hypothetical protein
MKYFSVSRSLLLGLSSALLVIAPLDNSQARKPTPISLPTPPPSFPAIGSWTDCNVVTDTKSFGPNTILTLSVTKTFTGTFIGSFTGTEYDFVHADGSAVFYGSGIFTGTVNGKSGTFAMNYIGRSTSENSFDAHWIIHDGTGDLIHLYGDGTLAGTAGTSTVACAIPFSGTYQGQLFFANTTGHP